MFREQVKSEFQIGFLLFFFCNYQNDAGIPILIEALLYSVDLSRILNRC